MIVGMIDYSNSIFHQIEYYHVISINCYIRINQIMENTESLRLDGNMIEVFQRIIVLATGYCEVALDLSAEDTPKNLKICFDLLRFCKKH
jgi:hypothetical protein